MRLHRQAGFTLVELMVGMLVGLIATIVMFQVFAVSEGQKRTTTGAGDAQQNGVISLYQMERDLRMAGYGSNLLPFLGCVTNGWNEEVGNPFSITLVPVVITNGGANGADTITVMSGSSDLLAQPERLRNPAVSGAAPFNVTNSYGFAAGDVIVVGDPGAAPPKPCTVAQVSSVIDFTLTHAPGTYVDQYGKPQKTKYNGAVAGFPGYPAWVRGTNSGGRIISLGQTPTFVTYAVQNGQLTAMDSTAPASSVVIADGIVQLKAQYGYDGDGNGRISGTTDVSTLNPLGSDQWADSVPAGMTPQQWSRIVAVRIAVVARSVTPEKPNASSGACETTLTGPRWFARNPTTPYNIDVSATSPIWGCYRYRVFETTIPLRNMAWFPQE
jgi:type IV pilus assembly protein PilW